MMAYLQEGFRYYHLLAISAVILALFALLGMGKYRVAWYFSISAPGAFLIPLQIVGITYADWPAWRTAASQATNILIILVSLCPIYWVAPIVFVKQCRDLARGHFLQMSRSSFGICVVLVALYLWCDLLTALSDRYAEMNLR